MSKSKVANFSTLKETSKSIVKENKSIWQTAKKEAVIGSKIFLHNGIVAAVFFAMMFIVAFIAIEVAYLGVALMIGYTGAWAMTTVADMLTMYTTLGMVCAIVLFFTFKIENNLIRALNRRWWRKDKEIGEIDKGGLAVKVNIEDKLGDAKIVNK